MLASGRTSRRFGAGALATWLAAGALGAVLAGCPAQTSSVTLILFTDFEPGAQVLRAHFEFTQPAAARPTIEGDLHISDFQAGERMFSASTGPRPFTPAPHDYAVTLITAEGPIHVTATNSFAGPGPHTVYLTITRSDCEGVVGCAADETCLCGGCFPAECRSDASGPGCPGSCCEAAGGCEEPAASCAAAFCTTASDEGRCGWEPREGACGADEWCDGRVGCVPLARLFDAGSDVGGLDASLPDAEALDAGSEVADACECTPGLRETAMCGNCGTQSRTCRPDCTWGAFDACAGEGCVVGTRRGRPCTCGTEYSYCRFDCTWGSYRDCPGPSCLDVSGARTVCAGTRGLVQCGTGGTFRDCLCSAGGSWTDCGFCE